MASKLGAAAVTAFAALVAAALGAVLGYMNANREMDVKMVEIAVGILSEEPKENIAPAREWAVDVIAEYAGVKPSQPVRDALVNYKVLPSSSGFGGGSSF